MFIARSVAALSAAAAALLLTNDVEARSFRSCSYVSFNHAAPVVVNEVVAPIAVPVVVPSTVFQYLPALQPIAPVAQIQGAAYTSPATTNRTQSLSLEDINKLIDQRVNEAIRNIFRNGTEGPPAIPEEGQAANTTRSSHTQLSAQATTILKNNCANCHGNGKSSGGVRLFDVNGLWAPNVSNDDILDSIRTARMPKAAKGDPKSPVAIKGGDLAILLTELGSR